MYGVWCNTNEYFFLAEKVEVVRLPHDILSEHGSSESVF